jgi:hypothetical protein
LLERAKLTTTASATIAIIIKSTLIFRFLKIWTNLVFVILFSGSPRAGELAAVPTLGFEFTCCRTQAAPACVFVCPAEEATALPLRFANDFVDLVTRCVTTVGHVTKYRHKELSLTLEFFDEAAAHDA